VSTTRHEFFGIGMIEAMAAGCIPLAPRRYNYAALVPDSFHEQLLWEDEQGLFERLRALLLDQLPPRSVFRESAQRFSWQRVAPAWDDFIQALSHHNFVNNDRATRY
jgi:hypothetical protein